MSKNQNSPFTFERLFETEIEGQAKMLLKFKSPNGELRSILLPYSLYRSHTKFVEALTDYLVPLPFNMNESKAICDVIMKAGPRITVTGKLVKRTGLYRDTNGDPFEFILPDTTITKSKNLKHIEKHYGISYFESQEEICWINGKMPKWISDLEQPCEASPYLIFAIAAGLSGPALPFFSSKTGLMFNFAGTSGTGKTTLLRAAQSVFKVCGNDAIGTLASTRTALEEQAMLHNNLILCLDEFGAVLGSPKKAIESILDLAYSINEGKGKSRWSGWNGESSGRWQTTILTTAEHTLLSILGEKNQHAGAMIRYIDIPIPDITKGGIFSLADKLGLSAAELISKTETTITENYGHALYEFVKKLLLSKADQDDLEILCNEFSKKLKKQYPDSQDRYREAFGRVYAAGKLAAKYRIVPFSEKQLSKALTGIFKSTTPSTNDNHQTASKYIQDLIELGLDKERCAIVTKGKTLNNEKGSFVAIRKKYKTIEHLFVTTKEYKNIIPEIFYRTFNKILKDNNVLINGDNSDTRTMLIEGLDSSSIRPSGYKLDWEKLKNLNI